MCQAHIKANGSARKGDTLCFAQNGLPDDFSRAAEAAANAAVFQPAAIDGMKVPVTMPFRVLFINRDSECEVTAIPNLGGEIPNGRIDFTAPQEQMTTGSWYQRSGKLGHQFPQRTRRPRCGMLFVISVAVSPEGVATDGRIERNMGMDDLELGLAVRSIEKSVFIPGFLDGHPQAMRYQDFLLSRCR